MTTALQQQLAALRAEIEATEKALAQAESPYPAKGTKGFFLEGTGGIFEREFDDDDIDRAYYELGRWFATCEEAELKDAYDLAVTRINRAILAGERGKCRPCLYRGENGNVWGIPNTVINEFAQGSSDSIRAIIKSHAADFEAVRKYQEGVLS